VIATDAMSRPSVLYYGSGAILGTLLWDGAWLAAEQVALENPPSGAWSISNVWPVGSDAFGYYRESTGATPTSFASIEWQ
jgi:hypothetical protein